MKEDHQKALKRVTLFFPSKPVPLNIQNYQKQVAIQRPVAMQRPVAIQVTKQIQKNSVISLCII